jgi:hypothetical protein
MRLFDRLFRFAMVALLVAAVLIALPMFLCQPHGLPLLVFRCGWGLLRAAGLMLIVLLLWDLFGGLGRKLARLNALTRA